MPDTIPLNYSQQFFPLSYKHQPSFGLSILSEERNKQLGEGKIVLNWPQLDSYLDGILVKLLPDSLKENKHFHVYTGRGTGIIPYSFPDGAIIIPLGAISRVNTEAELALLIAHEIAHVSFGDLIKNLEKIIEHAEDWLPETRNQEVLNDIHFFKNAELRADSLACLMAGKAGYKVKGGIHNVYTVYFPYEQPSNYFNKNQTRLNNADKKKKPDDLFNDWLRSVPLLSERILLFEKPAQTDDTTKKNFIIDEEKFKQIRKQAGYEYLEILLQANRFFECCNAAFIKYLHEPSDSIHVYYLCESIRRRAFLSPGSLKSSFLTDNKRYYFRSRGILHDVRFLLPDSTDRNLVRVPELTDTSNVFIENYADAFEYFSRIGEKMNYPPLLLTRALFYHKDAKIMLPLLEKYLADKNPGRKAFAESLLKNVLEQGVANNSKNAVYLNDPVVNKRSENGIGYDRERAKDKIRVINKGLRFVAGKELKDHEVLTPVDILSIEKKLRYRRAASLQNLLKEKDPYTAYTDPLDNWLPKQQSLDSGFSNNKNLFLFDPWLWEFFEAENIKSFTTVEIHFHDDRAGKTANWLWYFPPYWIVKIPQYIRETGSGSDRYSFSVTAVSYEPGRRSKALLYSAVTLKKMRKTYLSNELLYAFRLTRNYEKRF